MDTSILVLGSNDFFAKLPAQMGNGSCTLEVTADLNEAITRIQSTPPDILMIQISSDGSLALCCWLKEQTSLRWIYCIFLEDRPQMVVKASQHRDWEFEVTAAALEGRADAYVWLQPETVEAGLTPTQRLLLAQIQVGRRKAQEYHDLMHTNDVLSAIALADPLTELNNRRALEWELPRQIYASRNHPLPLSLIILDVDYFKVVNDTYGHLVGDRVLQLLCARLRHNLRFQDTPFRYGGEEFVILLGNTNCQEALVVAQRLGRLVSDQPFSINNTLTIKVTVSLGAACLLPEDDAKGVSLLHRADQHLLQAKAAGRNCVSGGCEDQRCEALDLGHPRAEIRPLRSGNAVQ